MEKLEQEKMLEVKEDKIRLTKEGLMSAIMCSANFCCRKDFEAFNNSETNIKHWINKRVLFSYHQTKKGWYENMKEKNKAGRVSKKTIATVLIAMIGTVGIGMCMSIAWSYAAPEIAKELWIYFVSFNLSNL